MPTLATIFQDYTLYLPSVSTVARKIGVRGSGVEKGRSQDAHLIAGLSMIDFGENVRKTDHAGLILLLVIRRWLPPGIAYIIVFMMNMLSQACHFNPWSLQRPLPVSEGALHTSTGD